MGLCAKPSEGVEPKGSTYAGLFLATLSLLQLELFLTRIFSVTMWYHFAFMAISLAMLGLAALAAAAFAWPLQGRIRWLASACCVVLLVGAGWNQSAKLIDIQWLKGGKNWHDGLYEKWNALSRIYVRDTGQEPFGWGMSPTYKPDHKLDQLYLNIDSGAATVITKFDGNLRPIDHLKYDVTAID